MGMDSVSPQSLPNKGDESVTDLVIRDLLTRREAGTKKYGTELQTFNGRDAMVDLYQELLDAVMYTRQALAEGDKIKLILKEYVSTCQCRYYPPRCELCRRASSAIGETI